MKKDWETKILGDLLVIERGGSPRPIDKYLTTSSDGINWIKISDATASDKYIYETKEKISKEGLHKTRMVNEGDFILSNSMSFGRPYIMKTTGCIHDGWLVLKQKGEKIFDTEFLFYLLSSPYVFNQFDYLAAGSTVRNLNIGLVSSVQVPIPSLPEQKRIVSILDVAFAAIAKAKANAEQNLKNVKELFESYLQGIFERRGDGWEEKILGDVCTTTQGVQIVKGEQESKLLPGYKRYLYISDFKNEKNLKYVKDIYPNKIVTQDDLIVVNTGNSAGDIFRGVDGILSNNLFKVTYNKKIINNDFIYYFVTSTMFRNYQVVIMRGTANPHMGHENFNSTPFCFPSIVEQQSIVQKLDALRAETQKLENLYRKKIQDLEELKKSILQKAFAGELS